jgi:hypothetical protein
MAMPQAEWSLAPRASLWQLVCHRRLAVPEDHVMRDPRNIVIAVLAAAVLVLGYLYYDSLQHRVTVNLPGFKLDAK